MTGHPIFYSSIIKRPSHPTRGHLPCLLSTKKAHLPVHLTSRKLRRTRYRSDKKRSLLSHHLTGILPVFLESIQELFHNSGLSFREKVTMTDSFISFLVFLSLSQITSTSTLSIDSHFFISAFRYEKRGCLPYPVCSVRLPYNPPSRINLHAVPGFSCTALSKHRQVRPVLVATSALTLPSQRRFFPWRMRERFSRNPSSVTWPHVEKLPFSYTGYGLLYFGKMRGKHKRGKDFRIPPGPPIPAFLRTYLERTSCTHAPCSMQARSIGYANIGSGTFLHGTREIGIRMEIKRLWIRSQMQRRPSAFTHQTNRSKVADRRGRFQTCSFA